MTNKKNIASKLVLALFILTLISCCLLGSTFARYASGGSGTASVGVAEWDVEFENDSTGITVDNTTLSPLMGEWHYGTDNQARTHSTGKQLVATITNSGEVDATVTVTAGALNVACSAAYATGEAIYANNDQGVKGDGASVDQIAALFSIKIYVGANVGSATEKSTFTLNAAGGTTTTQNIYAEVIWTSADATYNAATADAIDTWAGKYVTSVSSTISYTAVQNSTRPTT